MSGRVKKRRQSNRGRGIDMAERATEEWAEVSRRREERELRAAVARFKPGREVVNMSGTITRETACRLIDDALGRWYATLASGRCTSCEGLFTVEEVDEDEVSETLRAPINGNKPAGFAAYVNKHSAECELIVRLHNAEQLEKIFNITVKAALLPITLPNGSTRSFEVPVRVVEPGDPPTAVEVVPIR